jgi:hypothetical protein
VEDHAIVSEWWRVLSLKLTGFLGGMTRAGSDFELLSSATNPVNLDILLRKPTAKGRTLTVKGRMSCFVVALCYTDYALLRAIISDNVCRRVDTDKWDNVEKAYWMEEAKENYGDAAHDVHRTRLAYSSNARFVRYGKGGKKGQNKSGKKASGISSFEASDASSTNTMDVRFDLAGFSLKLTRDDIIEGILDDEDLAKAFHYDMVLFMVEIVEVVATKNSAGDISFNLSLFRTGLFDLGDKGRLIRERYYCSLPNQNDVGKTNGLRQPCPFHVLAEGYTSSKEYDSLEKSDTDHEPQFVVTIDTCPASSSSTFGSLSECGLSPETTVTTARIVINYLSVNAMVRPFREIVDFLTCKWPTPFDEAPTCSRAVQHSSSEECRDNQESASVVTKNRSSGFQLKLVAHYPRVFFLADESDAHSRALVLRG